MPAAVIAQQPSPLTLTASVASTDTNGTDAPPAPSALTRTNQPAPIDSKPLADRWLELETFSHSQRFRSAFQTGHQPGAIQQGGFRLFEDGQQRNLIAGGIKIDPKAKYTINFRASSGRYFNWSYADYAGTGIATNLNGEWWIGYSPSRAYETLLDTGQVPGIPSPDPVGEAEYLVTLSAGWEFYMRELYLRASPVRPLTFEFGSFGIERGFASEITTFDEDGYVTGERIRIYDPKHLFFDQVGFTNAALGNVTVPNLFAHGLNLDKSNYRQVFANKKITPRVGVSGEYTWMIGSDTLREAVSVHIEESKVADKIRFEGYQRLNTVNLQGLNFNPAAGFAIVADRKIGSHWNTDLGYDTVDQNYCVYAGSRNACSFTFSLNGDSYTEGRRYFSHLSYKITPAVTAFGFYTHAIGHDILNFNQQNFNLGMSLDLKALANSKTKVF